VKADRHGASSVVSHGSHNGYRGSGGKSVQLCLLRQLQLNNGCAKHDHYCVTLSRKHHGQYGNDVSFKPGRSRVSVVEGRMSAVLIQTM
jgi:hypothetical protein